MSRNVIFWSCTNNVIPHVIEDAFMRSNLTVQMHEVGIATVMDNCLYSIFKDGLPLMASTRYSLNFLTHLRIP